LRYWITRIRRALKAPDVCESTAASGDFGGADPLNPRLGHALRVVKCDEHPENPLAATAGYSGREDRRRARHIDSTFSRAEFIAAVERARGFIRRGDIYQVNLSQRLAAPCSLTGWDFFQKLTAVSPAPFAAFLDCGEFQVVSSSPELFLRLTGPHIQTRPIKGTRPRSTDPTRDAQLSYELQTSAKELAELVMITDLLRNDLGKVCDYGSVQVPELVRLERYPLVQHLVSTVEGRLRSGVTHFSALASCFPGGSITGAPKIRAMEIIDELEPVTRGPYTGAIGYLGFNHESQLSILIRAAVCRRGIAYFHVGAGIVADSVPSAEYEETLAKAGGFFASLNLRPEPAYVSLRK
jgi:para-aminobenzoate synthetase component 1